MNIEEIKLRAIKDETKSINRDNDLLKLFAKATENMQVMADRIFALEKRVEELENEKK